MLKILNKIRVHWTKRKICRIRIKKTKNEKQGDKNTTNEQYTNRNFKKSKPEIYFTII